MIKKINSLFILIICLFLFPVLVSADIGPKPSIDVKIKNLKTSNYIIDLFVYDEDGKAYESIANYNGEGLTEKQINKLHELNFDGWISESTRWDYYLLFADCSGNNSHTHHFSYFGTPERYKIVVINNDTGDIKISKEIVRDDFNSNITIDYKSMNNTNSSNLTKTIIIALACLVITLCVELLLAFIFKIGNYKTITLTNIITNIGLQLLLIILTNNYLLTFIIGEIAVIIIELIVYLLKFKDISKVKTIIYSLTANIVTIIISFLLYKI